MARWIALALLAIGCGGSPASGVIPLAIALPDSVLAVDGPSGTPLGTAEMLRRIDAADLVLLGEVHDNPFQHELRGRLLTAFGDRRPAVVFEQFAESNEPVAPAAPDESMEAWLDRSGFDRTAWRWPLHRPVVEAARRHARSIWGSNLSRDALRPVVREGESAAPVPLRAILARAPLSPEHRAALDQELVAGHCGRLPESMVVGMRAAQTVRDAAMAAAMLRPADDGPVWLIAGNGHVRKDFAVPRLLRVLAPEARVLSIGLLERPAGGHRPAPELLRQYDLVLVTPRQERPDPCAGVR